MKKTIAVILMMLLLFVCRPIMAEELTTDDIAKGVERGKSTVKSVPDNSHMTDGEKEAMKVLQKHNSDEYQNRIKSEMGRIQKFFDTGKWDGIDKTPSGNGLDQSYSMPSGRSTVKTHLAGDERVYVLVSSSVPLQTLRNYGYAMEAARDMRVAMVIRGLVEEKGVDPMEATMKFVNRVLTGQDKPCRGEDGCKRLKVPSGVLIDPLVFARFGVRDSVPAIVYARGVSVADRDKSEGNKQNMKVKDFYVLRGDVSLEYAIEAFQRQLAARKQASPGLEKLLAAVRGTGKY